MLSLSHTTGYAIQALSCLQEKPGELMLAREIATKTHIPRPYLSKILHHLVQSGLLVSKRGYRGGMALSRPADRISLLDIMVAVEGDTLTRNCLLGLEGCTQGNTCPVHDFWRAEQERIRTRLSNITLVEWANCGMCWKRATS